MGLVVVMFTGSYVLVVLWMLGGYPPLQKQYEFPDRNECLMALDRGVYEKAPEGHSHLVVFCAPKEGLPQ